MAADLGWTMSTALGVLALALPSLAAAPTPDTLHEVTLGAPLAREGWTCGPRQQTAAGMAYLEMCGRVTRAQGRPAMQTANLLCGRAWQSEVRWMIAPTGTRSPPGSAVVAVGDVAAEGRALWQALVGDLAGWTLTAGDGTPGPRAKVSASLGSDRRRELTLDTLPDGPGREVVQVVVRSGPAAGQPIRLDEPCPGSSEPVRPPAPTP
jgi:hypothetical protein